MLKGDSLVPLDKFVPSHDTLINFRGGPKMQKRFLIASLLLIILTSQAKANDQFEKSCASVDLRQSKCLPPAKNQSDTSFCFAFAAAEAVSFRLCKEVSPVALGIISPKYGEPTPRQMWSGGGWPAEAIEAGNEKGFCLEDEVPSQLLFNDETYALETEYRKLQGRIAEFGHNVCDNDLDMIRRTLPTTQIADIVNYIGSNQSKMDFTELVLSSCKHPLKEKVSVKSCEGNAHNKLRFVNDNIAAGPIPLGIKSSDPWARTGGFANSHAVTVIGRKFQDGSCKYLIRDSGFGGYVMGGLVFGGREAGSDRWVTEGKLLTALQADKSTCNSVQ